MRKFLIRLALRYLKERGIQPVSIEMGTFFSCNGRIYELWTVTQSIDYDRGSELRITAKEADILEMKKGRQRNG